MRSGTCAVCCLLAACVAACAKRAPTEPPHAVPSASLTLQEALWDVEDEQIVIRETGHVYDGETLLFRVDDRGRVYDRKGDIVFLLLHDGVLLDKEGAAVGWVGAGHSYAADMRTQVVYAFPDGMVTLPGEDGVFEAAGTFVSCGGSMLWTCTLVTHVLVGTTLFAPKRGSGSGLGQAGDLLKLLEILRVFK